METYRIVGIVMFLFIWALIGGIPSMIAAYRNREWAQTYGDVIRATIVGAFFGPFVILFYLINVLDNKELPLRKDTDHESNSKRYNNY